MLKKWIFGLLIMFVIGTVSGCSTSEMESDNGKIKITTTTGMIADIVRNVGGNKVEVVSLMKSGVDPHLYKASHGDIKKLDKAEIIFYNGLHLEGKMQEIFEKLERNKPTIPVSKNIPQSELMIANTSPDPHIWFDVMKWISAVETVRAELITYAPEHKEIFEKNAQKYIKNLQNLHNYAKERIAEVPRKQRVLVTAHDAFGYFGKAYDIEVLGLQGISTAAEVGSSDIREIRNFLVEKEIPAIFVESSVSKKGITAVIEGAAQQGHEIIIGGELFSDAMGAEGTVEGTYIGMVTHNVDTIVKALTAKKGESDE
ncbi:MAG: metal ABC transporter solute-binding protein, Zn/Mn family [Bacilli bacterium]